MPWLTIIIWLLSYFMSTKKGASKGKAALIATAAAGLAYTTIEPTNENALFADQLYGDNGIFSGVDSAKEKNARSVGATLSGSDAADTTITTSNGAGILSTIGGVANNVVDKTADVAKSWGPGGTAIAAGALSKNWWLIAAGVGAILLLR